MRISIFYAGYLPGEKYGGPVTSIYNFTELFGDEITLYIICSNHDLKDSKAYIGIQNGWNKVGKAKVLYLSEKGFSKQNFNDILDEIKPDIIYASSFFSARINYPLFSISKEKAIPLLLAPRGELNGSALKRKRLKKKIYISFLKLTGKLKYACYQATSENEKISIINSLGVNKERVFYLPNIPSAVKPKKQIFKEKNTLKMCFVGRIVENKNLLFAVHVIQKAKCNVIFDIYGSIEDYNYWEQCVNIINKMPQNIKIDYKGIVSPLKMNEIYSNYDCLISPTLFENYGQAIVESMLHDTPVIISKGTTPWDNIATFNAGYVLSLDNECEYVNAINKLGSMDINDYEKLICNLRMYCRMTFKFEELKARYYEAFELIAKYGGR